MNEHQFIFQPGIWIGEGRVSFSTSSDFMHYYTRWEILQSANPDIQVKQSVEMQGVSGQVVNHFIVHDISTNKFKIDLENNVVGIVTGNGVVDARTIAWEFTNNESFEGFEVLELQDNGDYMVHAEYNSTETFRTIIDGRIWYKGVKPV